MFKEYIKMLQFLRGHIKLFIIAIVTMLVASFFEVFQITLLMPMIDIVFNKNKIIVPNQLPAFVQHGIDQLNTIKPDFSFLFILIITFLTLLFLRNILVFGYQYMMGDVSQRVVRDIRFKLYEKIQGLSLDFFGEKRTGELISRVTNDVGYIENAISYALIDLFRQNFLIVFWIGTAFTIDLKAAFIIFFVFPIIGIPMARIGRRLNKISKSTQEKFADLNTHLLETISGIKLVKAFATEGYEINRFKNENQTFYKLRMQSIKR